ncbi:LysR family transcriptional regulator [Ghiorsea bivora]|uniref:LysR family transcriptional regulator n=1 Tax=Ghiorsea bivora TaxID=1485545 RepID=UPI0005706DEB|nr:LysR family transcriptional regulator [Ghiorsea bivora]
MTLEQLKYLDAIVKHGSFRAAAESVFRSQSSLSISIQKLEHELNIKLFERSGYRPILTHAGKAIYAKAKKVLNNSREIHDLARHLAQGHEAELRLAVSGIIPLEPIIEALNHINHQHPETRITLLLENLNGIMERIYDDDADIAITDAFEPDVQYEGLILAEIPFVTVVPSTSKWAQCTENINEEALENETMIIVRDTSHHSTRMSKGVLEGTPQWIVNDFETKRRILCSGKGWGRMPLHLVREDITQGRLSVLQFDAVQTFSTPIHLVRKNNKFIGPVEQLLWSTLQEIDWQTPT